MRSIAMAVLLAAALAVPVTAQEGRLGLTGPAEITRCGEVPVTGRIVAFVAPGGALVVLGGAPFPGGQQLGSLAPGGEAGGDEIAVPGVGSVRLAGRGPVWGLIDRTLGPGRPACLGFDKERFTWTSDLLTYVHWMAREVLWRLPEAAGRSLTVGDRRVTLEVSGPGLRAIELETVEGGTIGLSLPGSEARLLFMPLVLDADGGRVAVKILDPTGELFDAAPAAELAFVEAGSTAPVPIGTAPPVALRLVSVTE